MPESKLDIELRRSAEGTVESIRAAARADAERLALEADRQLADRRQDVMKDKEAEYRSEARVAVAAERHAAMRSLLAARSALVEGVLRRVNALLPEATRSDAYTSAIGEQLAEALLFVEGDDTMVRCSLHLEAKVREALQARPSVTIEPESDLGSGFMVVGEGGSVVVDGRLESRVTQLRPALAIEIHAHLEEL